MFTPYWPLQIMFKNKLKVIGLLVLLVGLYAILKEVVLPFAFDVAKSDLFLDGSEDNGSLIAVSTPMSDMAFKHCNTYITEELGDDVTPVFAPRPINAWDIGSYTFIVNGEVELQGKDGASSMKKYVCRIKFDEGDQNLLDNWSIYGVSGLDS